MWFLSGAWLGEDGSLLGADHETIFQAIRGGRLAACPNVSVYHSDGPSDIGSGGNFGGLSEVLAASG